MLVNGKVVEDIIFAKQWHISSSESVTSDRYSDMRKAGIANSSKARRGGCGEAQAEWQQTPIERDMKALIGNLGFTPSFSQRGLVVSSITFSKMSTSDSISIFAEGTFEDQVGHSSDHIDTLLIVTRIDQRASWLFRSRTFGRGEGFFRPTL